MSSHSRPALEIRMLGLRSFTPAVVFALFTCLAHGDDAPVKPAKKSAAKAAAKNDKKGPAFTAEELAENAKSSIVVILHTGRQGKQAGLGTGFVVDQEGLIATNYHVI